MAVDALEFKSLPDIQELPLPERKKIRGLLLALQDYELKAAKYKKAVEETKLELEKLQAKNNVRGFKCEELCFAAREMPGRKTIDKMALIENGVAADIIEKSTKTGKSYTERRFKDLAANGKEDSE